MNICLITLDVIEESNLGGLATYIENTAKMFAEKKHTVHIVFPSSISKTINKGNIIFHYINSDVYSPRFNQLFSILIFGYKALKKIKNIDSIFKIDIIECEDSGGVGIPTLLSKYRKIFITKLHGSRSFVEYLNRKKMGLKFWIIKQVEKIQIKNSAGITSNSESQKILNSNFFGIEKDKIVTIYCSMDLNYVKDIKSNYYNPIYGKYALYVGRLDNRKGINLIIKIYKHIFKKYGLKMVLVGEKGNMARGLYLKLNHALSSDPEKIIYLGKISRPKVYSLIKNSEFLILPSTWEPFGYTCLEGMALGKVVFATKGSGFEEQIDVDGKNGFLFSPNALCEIKDKIDFFMNLSNKRKLIISNNAINRASQFSNEAIYPKLIKYYIKIKSNNY